MKQPLTYIGRQASRSDGQARRIAILEAALCVIVSEGIRGVRHRSVARVAGVPLASTTYYFADIKELIHDSLTFFAEKTMAANLALEKSSFELLNGIDFQSLVKPSDRQQLCKVLSGLLCRHIADQVANRDARILEQAFNEEALRSPLLAEAIARLEDAFLTPIAHFFAQAGAKNSQQLAFEVLAMIRFLEYRFTVREYFDQAECEQIVGRQLQSMLSEMA